MKINVLGLLDKYNPFEIKKNGHKVVKQLGNNI